MLRKETIRSIKVAILAMGGEGGGVLADWIVSAAEHEGYYAQSTSVPGVAQRTGATIYYVEILPVARGGSQTPVFGLMPTPGDVDIVLASELMESARAIQRGLVTPDKTLLITSSHRVYSLVEKMAMADGRVESKAFLDAGKKSAKTFICQDFATLAEQNGSVISASLFGALAAANVMPWGRAVFEAAINRGGVGVAASLKAFNAGLLAFHAPMDGAEKMVSKEPVLDPRLTGFGARVERDFPAEVGSVLRAGVSRAADYQGLAYAKTYLDRLEAVRDVDDVYGDGSHLLLRETARYLALWMSYEDTVRVAELKIRKVRFDRVHKEVGVDGGQIVRINEFFHPRVDEIADTMPAFMGRWLLRSSWIKSIVGHFTKTGRVIRTSSLSGYLLLYSVALLKGLRMRSLRFERETAELTKWLTLVKDAARTDYALACELAECQRLVKGYGDTHARGMHSYTSIIELLPLLEGSGTATTVKQLREAALADESGAQLRAHLASLHRLNSVPRTASA
jgi:indolepyruvate ferredoxin oxidoreductase beta subunit